MLRQYTKTIVRNIWILDSTQNFFLKFIQRRYIEDSLLSLFWSQDPWSLKPWISSLSEISCIMNSFLGIVTCQILHIFLDVSNTSTHHVCFSWMALIMTHIPGPHITHVIDVFLDEPIIPPQMRVLHLRNSFGSPSASIAT